MIGTCTVVTRKRRVILGLLALCSLLLVTRIGTAGLIDPGLQQELQLAGHDEVVSTLVFLTEQVDLAGMNEFYSHERTPLAIRHHDVVRALQSLAGPSQEALLTLLAEEQARGRVALIRSFWVANVIRVDAVPGVIQAIAARADVQRVYSNFPIELIEPVNAPGPELPGNGGSSPLLGGVEPGVEAVRAPECWEIGIDGSGVLVSTVDTGVSGTHPALASRWAGLLPEYDGHPEWAWLDPYTGDNSFPFDGGSHGTHTMGSVVGGSPGDAIGVAPGASWISSGAIDRGGGVEVTVADAIESFEWLIDPDGNPQTFFDVPDVCSNSWGLTTGHGYPECDDLFWSYLDALETAGVVIVFSAGNEGTSGLRRPSDRATTPYRTLAVAAIDAGNPSYPVAGFSSRGPTSCTPTGEPAIKPDIAAPGVSVRSSVPGGGYSSYDGTSMASPHVNGVIALMRQANPDLPPDDIKQIIFDTALDLGVPGEDNNAGWGLIDAWAAVQAALESVVVVFSFPDGLPEYVEPYGGTLLRVEVTSDASSIDPGSEVLSYTFDGDSYVVSMDETEPGIYEVLMPATSCAAEVGYYFSVTVDGGDAYSSPPSAPLVTYSALAISGVETEWEDDFEEDTGWTVSNSATLTAGAWDRGVPAGGGDRGDPPTDADGSGSCYLTGNTAGDSDVDDGSTTLISPVLDASDLTAVLSYDRWFTNDYGGLPNTRIFLVEVSDDAGSTWMELETVGPGGGEVSGGWYHKEWTIADIPGMGNSTQFQVRFTASDDPNESVIEAGVDAVSITTLLCDEPGSAGDVDADGDVDFNDLLILLAAWGPCPACSADFDGDGTVDFADLLVLLANWS